MKPPSLVIWQMDNDRDPVKNWCWVSLAEYQVMRNVQTNTRYILIDNGGKIVRDTKYPQQYSETFQWEDFHDFPVPKPLEADEPLGPIMHHELGAGAEPEPPMSME